MILNQSREFLFIRRAITPGPHALIPGGNAIVSGFTTEEMNSNGLGSYQGAKGLPVTIKTIKSSQGVEDAGPPVSKGICELA